MKKDKDLKLLKRIMAIVLCAFISIVFVPLEPFAETTDSQTVTLDAYQFFVWLSQNEDQTQTVRNSAAAAARMLNNEMTEEDSKAIENDGSVSSASERKYYSAIISNTDIGADGDATNWSNFLKALDEIESGNAYRAKENLAPLTVSSVMMAMGEINANYQKSLSGIQHSSAFLALENLASSSGSSGSTSTYPSPAFDYDPYDGWYTREKAVYDYLEENELDYDSLTTDQKKEIAEELGINTSGVQVGHYETLTDRKVTVITTGFGYINSSAQSYEDGWYWTSSTEKFSQMFGFTSSYASGDDGISVSEYKALAKEYEEWATRCNHELVLTAAVAATCTEAGNSEYWTCSKCGKYFSDEAGTTEIEESSWVIGALGHKYGDWQKEDETNHKRVCANDESHVERAAHSWNDGEVTTAATCTTDGVRTYTCTVCGATKTEAIDALGHNWEFKGFTWTGNDTDGYTAAVANYVCKNDEAHTKTAEATVTSETTDPTCTAEGKTVYTATYDGHTDTKTETTDAALGHTPSDTYTVDKAATYAAAGSKSKHCTVCGESIPGTEQTIAKKTAPATKLTKLVKAKKALTAKWTKKAGVTGYQVQYGLKKNFKGAKTVTVKGANAASKKIKKLKAKKKYFVRIRTYVVENGKTYYSAWSAKKSVKTK